jgi:hypothetical protein
MPKVICEIEECDLDNENDNLIPGVRATCSKCGHQTEAFGTSERSIIRCLAQMREECPEGEKNYYVAEDGIGMNEGESIEDLI